MNGEIKFLADSNFIIYVCEDKTCVEPYLDEFLGISVITEIELLSYNQITAEEEKTLKSIISDCKVFQLSEEIKNKTIFLRRTYGIKLPNAIIAATAIVNNLILLTADKGFSKISELQMILLVP